ncbi:unnamed protein product [Litomosoides sigmodontis]|uniref:Uncharacterized protein n=1 Tax=Litomosoides sigmodontis TaxID=42156 RepID=A0A3P7M6N8_LITSI|nr:unnamed protein product [Litomosoides sigmodontis]
MNKDMVEKLAWQIIISSISPSGQEGANISGFLQAITLLEQPLGSINRASIRLTSSVNYDASVRDSEITRVRKNFPESWIWSAAFAAE